MGIVGRAIMESNKLVGKTAVITGANTGIGKETARHLLKQGARVIIACRSASRAEEACRDLKADLAENASLEVIGLDLSSLASVRECAVQLISRGEKINILINNAGVMACPYSKTQDGIEMQFGVNHVGHFLLTTLLLPVLTENAPSRIVTVSSHAHYAGSINLDDLNSEKSYSPFRAYAQSKLANVLFSKELGRRLHGTGVTSYSVHPGLVATELGRHIHKEDEPPTLGRRIIHALAKTPAQGAQTSIYCAVSKRVTQQSGWYYSRCGRALTSPLVLGEARARRLWEETEKLVAPFSSPIPRPSAPSQ
ncbi:hypothetical protein B566_EDAN009877 [Ephemera danica]|nr:hypothetical protein B566_EDAN009877 [Ephemera danica]